MGVIKKSATSALISPNDVSIPILVSPATGENMYIAKVAVRIIVVIATTSEAWWAAILCKVSLRANKVSVAISHFFEIASSFHSSQRLRRIASLSLAMTG